MSAQTHCPDCGWHRVYRSQKAANRAARTHRCQPGAAWRRRGAGREVTGR